MSFISWIVAQTYLEAGQSNTSFKAGRSSSRLLHPRLLLLGRFRRIELRTELNVQDTWSRIEMREVLQHDRLRLAPIS
jgi:hypothetical protein